MPRYPGSVTGNHSDLPALPLRLSPLQVLGLRNPDEGDWARLRALHPYDVPEFVVLEAGASGPYGTWVRSETSG